MRASIIRSAIVTFLLALSFGIVGAQAQERSDPPGSDQAGQPLDAEALRALGISGEAAQSPAAPPVVESGGFSWTHGPLRYDGSGNIASIGTQAFYYDTHGRLAAATLSRPDQAGSVSQSYLYDSFGNQVERTTGGVVKSSPADTVTNHLSTAFSEYDAAGNQVRWQSGAAIYHATYDAVGTLGELDVENITGAGPMFFVYTASDERIWSHDGAANIGHWKLRDLNGKVLRDFVDNWNTPSSPWSVSRDYFYRDGALLAAATPTTTLHFSLDHLGSPRVITDNGRVRMGFHHYLPFGEEWLDGTGSQEGEVMKFTGHERDKDPAGSAADLDYMHARYYSAAWGRFMSVDPSARSVVMVNPESWNRYAYVGNNPLNGTDPDGRCSFVLDDGTSYTDDSPICMEVKPHWSPEVLLQRGDEAVAREQSTFEQERAHWTLDVGGSTPLPVKGGGGAAGVQFSDSGVFAYGGFGFVSSPGWSVMFSPTSASEGESDSVQFSVPDLPPLVLGFSRPGINWLDPTQWLKVSQMSYAIGVGSKGVAMTHNKTVSIGHPVDEVQRYYAKVDRGVRHIYGIP